MKQLIEQLPITNLRVRGFKALVDSGEVVFGPLTTFIGNNGSGKSSLIEALEAYQAVTNNDLNQAFGPWRGIEYIRNQVKITSSNESFDAEGVAEGEAKPEDAVGRVLEATSISINLAGFHGSVEISDEVEIDVDDRNLYTYAHIGWYEKDDWAPWTSSWQFLNLEPANMVAPIPQVRWEPSARLAKDGSNIAQYLLQIAEVDSAALRDISDALRTILPYSESIRPAMASELARNVYLQMLQEGLEAPLPGWLLSQGTVRIVALLAILRNPSPPSLLVIEEVENGLDPRALHFILNEINEYLAVGNRQVIMTTHSPYLLDLLPLDSIVVCERVSGTPEFWRPIDDNDVLTWAKRFAPGQLYTSGAFRRRDSVSQ